MEPEAFKNIPEEEGEGEEQADTTLPSLADALNTDLVIDNLPTVEEENGDPKLFRLAKVELQLQPPSYQKNTEKEEEVLRYVERFRRQFYQLYPTRRELPLLPWNECGAKKFVCSTLKPTQLPYKELYTAEGCAKFVADHITFEPLYNPLQPPEYLPSPTFTLEQQIGDCFDISIVLVSLLLGVGYDAFCVFGYASKRITMKDETMWTLTSLPEEDDEEEEQQKKEEEVNPYKNLKKPPLESQFEKQQKERVKEEKEKERKRKEEAKAREAEDEDERLTDEYYGRRVHCWVFVRAGKREVTESFFLEPSTGVSYPVSALKIGAGVKNPLYHGIEAVWNHRNYWVNMQGFGPSPLEQRSSMEGNDPAEENDGAPVLETKVPESTPAESTGETNAPEEGTNEEMRQSGAENDRIPEPEGGVQEAKAALAGKLSLELEDQSRWEHIFLEEDPDAPTPESEPIITGLDKALRNEGFCDLPTSWVLKLIIPRERYQLRAPQEKLRDDGMTRRLTVFTNEKRQSIKEIHEVFKHREDRLKRRVSYELIERKIEKFCKGRRKGLKEIVHEPDRREIIFYPSARQSGGPLDGLVRRVELFNKKTMLFYERRDDKLIYRSITFDEQVREEAMKSVTKANKAAMSDAGVVKMAEKFDRNPKIEASSDIRKRTFFKTTGDIRLDYHFGEGRITANSKTFKKDMTVQMVQLDAFEKGAKEITLKEEFAVLMDAERECMAAIKMSDREAEKILERRKIEEDAIKLAQSIYDLAKLKAEEDESGLGEEEEEEETEYDYLAPFLPPQKRGPNAELTQAEAVKAQESCLAAMKERLLERAHIIDSRLEEEKAALQKRNANYQRNRDHLDKAEEEEYENFVQQATFRIRILKQRREQHGQQAHEKYRALIERLLNDKRISKHIKG